MAFRGYIRCGLICYIIIGLIVPFTSISIGAMYAEDECLKEDEVGINLSQWLIGGGISTLIMLCFLSILTCFCTHKANKITVASFVIWSCVSLIFGIIYGAIGITLYFRSSMECMSNSLGIMGMIQWIFFMLPVVIVVLQCFCSMMFPEYTKTYITSAEATEQAPVAPKNDDVKVDIAYDNAIHVSKEAAKIMGTDTI